MDPKLTILVPTLNRRHLLKGCLEALLAQAEPGVVIRVFDSGSTDGTVDDLADLASPALESVTDRSGLTLFDNWSRALESVTTPYLAIVSDDDLWYPGYAQIAIDALDRHPTAALVFADVELIDISGEPVGERPMPLPPGRFDGLEYLERIVDGQDIIVDSSAAVIRTDAFRSVGGLDRPHMNHDIIFNYQFRLAARHDFVRIPETLVAIRQHEGQIHHDSASSLAAVGMTAERMEAAARLLTTPRAEDAAYRDWLAERLIWIGWLRSQYTADAAPALNDPPGDRFTRAVDTVLAATDPAEPIAVVGDDLVHDERLVEARTIRPFPSVDGHYTGVPVDDAQAIDELRRCIADGVALLVVAWPSFWWLDYYHGLRELLRDHRIEASDSSVVVYRLVDSARRTGYADG